MLGKAPDPRKGVGPSYLNTSVPSVCNRGTCSPGKSKDGGERLSCRAQRDEWIFRDCTGKAAFSLDWSWLLGAFYTRAEEINEKIAMAIRIFSWFIRGGDAINSLLP